MKQPTGAKFTDRLEAQKEAKQALLAKFKPKPMVQAEAPIDRAAEREAELEAVRAARAAQREAERQAALERQANDLAAKRAAIKERKARAAAEQRARREARYSARLSGDEDERKILARLLAGER